MTPHTTPFHGTLRAWMLVLGLTCCFLLPARCEEVSEYRLKAAFLYKFAAFVEWPTEVGEGLNLCIYGHDPFGSDIDGLQGKPVGSRKIMLQRVASIGGLKGCHIAFISSVEIDQLPRVVAALSGLPVLTVADTVGAARAGAVLNLVMSQGRIGFEANLGTAKAARLSVSARLLVLAKEVIQ